MTLTAQQVHHGSPSAEKIAIFRSLFRGREDVYPRRFESRTSGKTGYSPVCANEWVTGICEKPRVKCAVCQHRQFLPVTDDVIERHLLGTDEHGADFVAGVYPMLLDETCFYWPSISINPDGKLTRQPYWKRVGGLRYRRYSSGLDREMAVTSGYFLKLQSPLPWHVASALMF